MQQLTKFKKSELGEIPEDWTISRLLELCYSKPQYGAAISAIPKNTNLPRYIRITDLNDDGSLKPDEWKSITDNESKPYLMSEGQILFARTGATVGKTYLYKNEDGKCAFAGYLIRFIPNKDKLDSNYLFHYTHSELYWKWLRSIQTEGVQPNVNAEQYGSMVLPNPPVKEQQKIAFILSRVDDLLQKTDQIIKQTQRLKKGLMQRLLTKGIGHTKFKKVSLSILNISNLTEIPYEWEARTIRDIANINPESINGKYPHEYIKYIEIGAISNYQIQNHVLYNLSKRPSRAQRVVRKGDIIVSTVRPYLRGFTLITDSGPNLICSTGFTVIRPKNRDDENFIFNYIKSKYFEDDIFRRMEGMAYPAITSSDVANAIIPYPVDKSEKMKIGFLLHTVDSSIKQKYSIKLEVENLKKGLMQKLLTGKIRVKV